ncbi:MAG: hypothetical protein LBI73_01980 [Myroides sp.]|jgi:hypothetical protein|nr:hypothetical protein [Myroides sp.]
MKKYYYIIIAFLSLLTLQAQTTKSSTYEYPLTDIDHKNLPNWIDNDYGKWEQYAPKNEYRFTSEGIVLTIQRTSASAFAITDLELDLRQGARFEFEFAMAAVRGSGYQFGGGGMTFFIYDADESLSMGYLASALGYSFNGSTAGGSTAVSTGLNGGYLGIGFDLDGNNKERKGFGMTSYETREGLSHLRYNDAGFHGDEIPFDFGRYVFDDYYKNHITLRGAGQGDGYKGNPLLLTQYFGGKDSSNGIAMAQLDYDTGEYDFSGSDNGDYFNIADGDYDSDPNFQKIEVILVPDGEAGMYITVKGNDEILIDRFYYKHSFITYGEGKGEGKDYVDYQYDFETSIPERVNIGFAGTTMDNNHQKIIIRNLKVTPGEGGGEEGVKLKDEYGEVCVVKGIDSTGAMAFIDILEDTDYDVDWDSFRFVDRNGNHEGETPTDYYSRWEYDSDDRRVTTTIMFDDFDPGEDVEMYFTVEIDGVESQPAKIRVRGAACGASINPHIRTHSNQK